MIAFARAERRLGNREEALWLVPLTFMSIGAFLTAQVVGLPFGLSPWAMLSDYAYKALRVLPLVLYIAAAFQIARAVRVAPKQPLAELINHNRGLLANPWLAAARIGPLLLTPVIFVAFSALKMLMPRFVPFWLDDSFAAMDRLLFFGWQPWELTHFLFESVQATFFIDKIYTFWVLLLSIAIVTVALFAPRQVRARFFLSFALAWLLLGVGGAWLGASAGPCYSELVGAASAPEFRGLIDRLAFMSIASEGAINAPSWQQVLWRAHSSETYAFGMGISAMPSLHNAIATLYALAAFRIGRLLGWFMTVYALLIFVGSVHLGWHYAVDGPIGAIAMVLIWRSVDLWCRCSGYDDATTAATADTRAVVQR